MAATRPIALGRTAFVMLTCCTIFLATAPLPLAADDTSWQHDPATPGDWFDEANWTNGLPHPQDYTKIENGGTAELTAGDAEISNLYVAANSGTVGHLVQSGGSLQVKDWIGVATSSGNTGSYTLSGTGVVTGERLTVGTVGTADAAFTVSGSASATFEEVEVRSTGPAGFHQSGGTFTATNYLSIGPTSGMGGASSGRYLLTGGLLQAKELIVNPGGVVFRQEGGSADFDRIRIDPGGRYEMTDGECAVSTYLFLQGTMDFGDGHGLLMANDGAWVNLSSGAVQNTSHATLSMGSDSLLLVAPGFDPATAFGTFSTQGLVHEVGCTFVVLPGEVVFLQQDLDDHLVCAGTVTGWRRLMGGVTVLAGGTVDLSAVSHGPAVLVEDAISGNWGGSLNAYSLWIGKSGTGVFTHASGDATFVSVRTGYEFGSDGTLLIEGGTLDAERIYAGFGGTGRITQTGGTVTASETLYVGGGSASGGYGTYDLSAGQLTTASAHVGYYGSGEFNQSGGTCTVHDTCRIGQSDRYEMTGGTLNVGQNLEMDQGADLHVSGGTVNVGEYLWMDQNVELDFLGGPGAIQFGDRAMADFSKGQIHNASAATITAGEDSLMIFPAGFDPYSDLGTYSCPGLTHVAGSPMVVPAGKHIYGRGEIEDPVHCQGGAFEPQEGQRLEPMGGVRVTDDGSLDLGGGWAQIRDATSGITSGQFSGLYVDVGDETTARFTQEGGTVAISSTVRIGYEDGLPGEYVLSGGELTTATLRVGEKEEGRFIHTGGTNAASSITVGYCACTPCSYHLSGTGSIQTGGIGIGYDCTPGYFEQTGETSVEAGLISIGTSGGEGTYTLDAGSLSTHKMKLGTAPARFTQNGGTCEVTEELLIRQDGAYELHDTAELDALYEMVLGGHFNQSGGTNSANYVEVAADGQYTFSGGVFESTGVRLDGPFDFTGTAVALAWGDSIVDVADGAFLGGENVSLTLGPRSLLLIRPGDNPDDWFQSLTNHGFTHTVGDTLTIPAGRGISGSGAITDHVECAGELIAAEGCHIHLSGGLTAYDGVTVDLGNGDLQGPISLGATTVRAHSLLAEAEFTVTDGAAEVSVTRDLRFDTGAIFTAPPGTTIRCVGVTRAFNESANPAAMTGLENTRLVFEDPTVLDEPPPSGGNGAFGGVWLLDRMEKCNLECASEDRGCVPAGFTDNFVLGHLVVGDRWPVDVWVLDNYSNAHSYGDGGVYVHDLTIGPGSRLKLFYHATSYPLYADGAFSNEGMLDVAEGLFVLDYPDEGPSPFADVAAQVASGYRDGLLGYWDGAGITSFRAARDPQRLKAVAVIDNMDPETGVGGLSEFAGKPVDETAVIVAYTWYGDANLDGVVDTNDYDRINTNWLLWTAEGIVPEGGFRWAVGDFNYDGTIDTNDYDKINNAWLLSGSAPLGGATPSPTPEPATLALLAAGGLVLLRRKT